METPFASTAEVRSGLIRPDRVAAQRAVRHEWLFLATLGYLALLLVVHGLRGLTADTMIWRAAVP